MARHRKISARRQKHAHGLAVMAFLGLAVVSAVLLDEFDRGHHGTVIEWLARIPPSAVESNHQLRLVTLSSIARDRAMQSGIETRGIRIAGSISRISSRTCRIEAVGLFAAM